MSLVKREHLKLDSIPHRRFNLNPSCSICNEEFDSRAHIPKVLNCGHTLCLECIQKMIGSMQVSYTGDGEVSTCFVCPSCPTSMTIPRNGASGFPTNHELTSCSSDARYLCCTTCEIHGCESSFHICRECTIDMHGFDVQTILETEPTLHPDSYIICSTCVLKDHNTIGHTVIEYLPIRLNYQFSKHILSANVNSAQAIEKFSILRTIVSTIPVLLEKNEQEVSKMVEMVQKAKSSQSQRLIFQQYEKEIKKINKLLDELIKDGGKLNNVMAENANALNKVTTENSLVHCHNELPDLTKVLKIPETPIEPVEPVEPLSDNETEPVAVETVHMDTSSDTNARQVEVIEQLSVEVVLTKVWEFICIAAIWMYNLQQTAQTVDRNNNNQEVGGVPKNLVLVGFVLVLLIFIVFKILF